MSEKVKTGFSDLNLTLKKNNSLTRSNITSTWKINSTNENEYITEKKSQFINPKYKNNINEPPKINYEEQRDKMRNIAIQKFNKLAIKKYGSIEGLFNAFKKDSNSTLTLDELSEQLRKRNMDLYFPRDDQRLLFEKLDTTHSSKIQVGNIIQHFNENPPNDPLIKYSPKITLPSDLSYEETEVKDLILSKIDKQRETSKLAESPRQTKLQLVRALRNLDPDSTGKISIEQLNWALGPKYLGLGLTDHEIQSTIKASKSTEPDNQINYTKFVRELGIRNTEPICDPFFDRRANQITRLKQRIISLDEFTNDPAILERREELTKICMVGPGPEGLEKYLDPSRSTTQFRPLSPSPLLRNSQSQPTLSSKSKVISGSSTLSTLDLNFNQFSTSPGPTSIESEPDSFNNTKNNNNNNNNNNTIYSSPVKSQQQQYQQQKQYYHQLIDTTTQVTSDRSEDKQTKTGFFRATLNAPARTYVKYPMTVDVSKAHAEHKESLPGGKRHGPEQPYDEKLLHHDNRTSPSLYIYQDPSKIDKNFNSSNSFNHTDNGYNTNENNGSNNNSGRFNREDKRWLNVTQSLPNLHHGSLTSPSVSYVSTNDEYFTPLDYQPSKPVSRPGVLGDAMKCAIERDIRRRKRYERTRANLQSFKDHAELNKISQALNEASRAKGRVLESLQYELTAFHTDLAVHHSRPVETMQKKPNPELYKKIWGGNIEKVTHDNRDFKTTYEQSYFDPSSTISK